MLQRDLSTIVPKLSGVCMIKDGETFDRRIVFIQNQRYASSMVMYIEKDLLSYFPFRCLPVLGSTDDQEIFLTSEISSQSTRIKPYFSDHLHIGMDYLVSDTKKLMNGTRSFLYLGEDDIICTEDILELCDLIVMTKEEYNMSSVLLQLHLRKVVVINDLNNINASLFNSILRELQKNGISICASPSILTFLSSIVKVHSRLRFAIYILTFDDTSFSFDMQHKGLVTNRAVDKIFVTAINCPTHPKLQLLPKGVRTCKNTLHDIISNVYFLQKQNNLLLSPQNVDAHEIAKYCFCFCPIDDWDRDSSSFWECLYLGTIPIIKSPRLEFLVEHLRQLTIPFYVIQNDDELQEAMFNASLYQSAIHTLQRSIYRLPSLQLQSYNYYSKYKSRQYL
jgi:hypothetical protein